MTLTADVAVHADDPVETWVDKYCRSGFVVIDPLLQGESLAKAQAGVNALMDNARADLKWIRQRTYEHFAAHPVFVDLLIHPQVMAFANHLLGDDFHAVAAQCSRNLRDDPYTVGAMNIHRDRVFLPHDPVQRPLWRHGFSAMWYMQDTPLAMGPTELIPGSHLSDVEVRNEDLAAGEDTWHQPMPAGSLLLFSHATYHRGALNNTDTPRDLITNAYTTRAIDKVQLTVKVDGEKRYVPYKPLLAQGDAAVLQLLGQKAMDEIIHYTCPHCGESIQLSIDPSGGARQDYIEDCPVCCSPNQLRITFDRDGNADVDVQAS